jgi:hypothetical protein
MQEASPMPGVANLLGPEVDIRLKVESLVALGFLDAAGADRVAAVLEELALLTVTGALDEGTAREVIAHEARCVVEQWQATKGRA